MKSRGKHGTATQFKGRTKQTTSPKFRERNLDNFKLLVAYPAFQEEVCKIQAELEIKAGGFSTTKEAEEWNKRVIKKTDIVWKHYSELVEKIKTDSKNNGIGYRMMQRQLEMLYSGLPFSGLESYASYLIGRFNLPQHYQSALVLHLLYGTISAPVHNYKTEVPSPLRSRSQPSGFSEVRATIYTRLTKDEQRELIAWIERITNERTLPKYEPLVNIDRDLKIKEAYEAYKENRTGERGTIADLAEEYLGDRKKANQINAILRDLSKIQKSRFEKVRKKRS
ncbi:MAG: hypothetical protein Q8O71_03055 [bacterium]|nr:hypothetical protein [bacterium]